MCHRCSNMWALCLIVSFLACCAVQAAVRSGASVNLLVNLKPVGGRRQFVPIKDLPPPRPSRRSGAPHEHSPFIAKLAASAKKPKYRVAEPPLPIYQPTNKANAPTEKPTMDKPAGDKPELKSGRRHLQEECVPDDNRGKVDIFVDYYNIETGKDMATVIWPDHVDHKFYEVTTPELYYTVGTIHGIGHHPTTPSSDQPDECERIYEEFMEEQYDGFESSEESTEHVVITTETDYSPDIETTTDPCVRPTPPDGGDATNRDFFDQVK